MCDPCLLGSTSVWRKRGCRLSYRACLWRAHQSTGDWPQSRNMRGQIRIATKFSAGSVRNSRVRSSPLTGSALSHSTCGRLHRPRRFKCRRPAHRSPHLRAESQFGFSAPVSSTGALGECAVGNLDQPLRGDALIACLNPIHRIFYLHTLFRPGIHQLVIGLPKLRQRFAVLGMTGDVVHFNRVFLINSISVSSFHTSRPNIPLHAAWPRAAS